MCRSQKAVLASSRHTHGCIRKANRRSKECAFASSGVLRDASSFSLPMVLWVVSRLCFSSERAISMGPEKRKEFGTGEGRAPSQFYEEACSTFKSTALSNGSRQSVLDRSFHCYHALKALKRWCLFGEKYVLCVLFLLESFVNCWKEAFK